MAKAYTAGQRQKVMTSLLKSKQGRSRIAATITEPLRSLRDYTAVGRKALMVDELPNGELPIYDKDPELRAYVVGEEANSIQQVVKSDRILIPTFEMATLAEVPFTQVRQRRYDVPKRIREKTRSEIFRLEDRLVFSAISAAANANSDNSPISVADNALSMDTYADAFAQVERHGLRVDKVYMNGRNFTIIRKAGEGYLDFETQKELLRTGFMGSLWGASVYISPEVPEDEIYVCAEPDMVGVMPIELDLTVLPADDPRRRQFGWSVFQAIGIGIHNADRGLQMISVTDLATGPGREVGSSP